jgi:hypothetical protein
LAMVVVMVVALLFGGGQKISGSRVGISLHALSEDDAKLVEESGVDWIRIDCSKEVEAAFANAKNHGLKILAILDSWTLNYRSGFLLDEWESNVTYYVSQYADYVDAWEIWNEPANPRANWTLLNATLPDEMSHIVDFYYSMVQIASSVIREYDPSSTIVLFGGLSLFSGGDSNLEYDMDFAGRLATMGIEQYGDAFSVHAYPWSNDMSLWSFRAFDNALAYYRELFPSLEVWVTETGHYIDSEREEGQARYMQGAIEYFKESASKFFWYSLLDNEWEIYDQGQPKHFGLIGDDGPRPAYYELKSKMS